jgi:hypothetical protein
MKIRIAALAAIFLCSLVACDRNSKHKDLSSLERSIDESTIANNKSIAEKEQFLADTIAQLPAGKPEDKKEQDQRQQAPNPDWDKKIIKTASLNLEVKDYKVFYSSMREKVRSLGGYVAQEEQSQSDYKIENTLVIKVPVDQFDNAVTQLTANVEKINERKVSSQDVTSEYIDTRSRIEAKKQVRLRYMDLLKQAKNMEEILSVQSEINGIQEEIESATGRIEYLGHSSSFSTITLTYYQVLNSSAKNNDAPPSLGAKIAAAFKTGWSWIVDLFVGLITIWPLCLLVFALIIVYKRTRPVKPKEA